MPNLLPPLSRFLITVLLLPVVVTLGGCSLRNTNAYELGSTMPSIPSNDTLDSILSFYEAERNLVFQDDWRVEFGYLNSGTPAKLATMAEVRGYKRESISTGCILTKIKELGSHTYEIKITISNDGGKNLTGRAMICRSIIK